MQTEESQELHDSINNMLNGLTGKLDQFFGKTDGYSVQDIIKVIDERIEEFKEEELDSIFDNTRKTMFTKMEQDKKATLDNLEKLYQGMVEYQADSMEQIDKLTSQIQYDCSADYNLKSSREGTGEPESVKMETEDVEMSTPFGNDWKFPRSPVNEEWEV